MTNPSTVKIYPACMIWISPTTSSATSIVFVLPLRITSTLFFSNYLLFSFRTYSMTQTFPELMSTNIRIANILQVPSFQPLDQPLAATSSISKTIEAPHKILSISSSNYSIIYIMVDVQCPKMFFREEELKH